MRVVSSETVRVPNHQNSAKVNFPTTREILVCLAISSAVLRPNMRLAHRATIRRLASKPDLKATLNLPRTEFALHANLALTEHRLVPRLAHEHFSRQADARASAPPFVLHDGPPYANGELHMGHFLNKSLKDMINRWKLLRGYRIEFTPGWDCHGLPIELRALQLAGAEAAHELPPLRVREQAAECARQTIAEQRQSFVRMHTLTRPTPRYLNVLQ